MYSKYNLKKIKDLIYQPNKNNYAQTMGIINQIREIKTKKDEVMAFGTISDDISEYEIVLFPRVYESLNLEVNKIYIISGEIRNQNNNLQLVVNRIEKI
jgi:DNA polymerase-3 subunit alpha